MIMDYQSQNLLEQANKELAQFGTEIKVVENENHRYDILIVSKDQEQPTISAEGVRSNQLPERIENTWSYALLMIERNAKKQALKVRLHTYRELKGDAQDGEVSMFAKYTEYPLLFLLPNGTIESVRNASDGASSFKDRKGVFVCREEDYEQAMIQIEEHE